MNTMWDTGSKFDGHHTASNRGGWYFDSNKLFYSGSDTSHNKITQNVFTSSDGSTVDQFIINQTYKIEFDVVDFYKAGEVRFDFGVSAGAPQRKSFTISGAGHQKDLLQLDSLQTSPNNKLVIQAFSGFSGSIDNISIVRTTDQDGKADIFNDTYFAENPLLGHYDGRWYLSFWAKWQELPTWENSNASQSSCQYQKMLGVVNIHNHLG